MPQHLPVPTLRDAAISADGHMTMVTGRAPSVNVVTGIQGRSDVSFLSGPGSARLPIVSRRPEACR